MFALCLCVGAAVAAPQLRLGPLRSVSSVSSVTNQDEVSQRHVNSLQLITNTKVVTNVVSALTPSIAAAVEEALAAQAAAEEARLEAKRRAAAAASKTNNKADAEPAKYNFEYKVDTTKPTKSTSTYRELNKCKAQ